MINHAILGAHTAVQAIDRMIERVNEYKVDPQFTQQLTERRNKTPDFTLDDQQILRVLMVLIAYSNNANAERVTCLVEGEIFESIFQKHFTGQRLVTAAETIIGECWQDLTAIRFKYKVDAWTRCARCLLSIQSQYGSFMKYLEGVGLPSPLRSDDDIRAFWEGFNKIRAYFLELRFPYFANFTSLCHLLMHLGFDAAKPDIIVMKAAVNLGIVPSPPKQKRNPGKSRAHPEENLKQTVNAIQAYAVYKGTRAPLVDLYFLIHGGQSDAIRLVRAAYYSQRALASRDTLGKP